LLKATRYAANAQIRTAVRRSQREQEACMQSIVNESSSAVWEQLAPLLDEAMASLGDTDRNILALRYFENKTAQEIGRALTLNEQTAQKRANRALEKLRKFFTKRGVSSTTAVMAGAISANSVQAAPVALAKSVTAVAIVKGAAASASTLTLIKGASGGGLVRCRRPPAWPGTQRRPLPFNRQDARVSLTILPGAGHEDPAFMATQMLPTFAFLDKTFGR